MHSFQSLLKDLATLSRNRVRFTTNESDVGAASDLLAQPTPLQQRAFALLNRTPTM